ncbi:MAG: regulatory protein RecX [Bacillales bacterium]
MKDQLEKNGKQYQLNNIKIKDNDVYLYFNGLKVKLLFTIYLNYPFKIGDVYDSSFINEIITSNKNKLILNSVINKIYKHIYCVSEVKLILEKKYKNESKEFINTIVDYLIKNNYINEEEYVKNYMLFFNKNFFGKYYILNFFQNKYIKKELVDSIEFDIKNELTKANNYYNLIKNKYVASNVAKTKRNIYNALLRRGFSNEISSSIVESIVIDKTVEIKKLTKDYNRISKKINSNIKIRNKKDKILSELITLGYNYEDILDIVEKENNND